MRKLLICVPLYKSAHLIEALFESLRSVANEVIDLDAEIILIIDSPNDELLSLSLEQLLPVLAAALPTRVIVNERNIGFVRSINICFGIAISEGSDVVILNSDALLSPGSLTEILQVAALDPMIGFVSPRSNNATICNSPYPEKFRKLGPSDAVYTHKVIANILPRMTYVPTAVGFCLFVRNVILEEFGGFDEIYGGGYNEENDLIMRSNRRGYRAVLANRAFVYHIGSVSFGQSEVKTAVREESNRKILLNRYPEYVRAVERYFDGIEYKAQYLLAGMVPDQDGRHSILFDCNNLAPYFNGTFELAVKTIRAFISRYSHRYSFYITCSQVARKFHGLHRVPGLRYCRQSPKKMAPFSVAIRLAQPFDTASILDICEYAPITGFLMLDTLALDCQNLDDQNLMELWSQMLRSVSAVGYISEFSKQQFGSRFDVPTDVVEFVSLCSTNHIDYNPVDKTMESNCGYLLIVGNHFSHKHVNAAVEAILQRPNAPQVVVLGLDIQDTPGVTGYPAGDLEQSLVDDLYDKAMVVLFPSHYEGFGLPIMHAIARKKPIVARNIPVFEEIRSRNPFAANIYLFDTTDEMVEFATSGPQWSAAPDKSKTVHTWEDSASSMEAAFSQAIRQFSFSAFRNRLRATTTLRDSLVTQTIAVPDPAASVVYEYKSVVVPSIEMREIKVDMDEYSGVLSEAMTLLRSMSEAGGTNFSLAERIASLEKRAAMSAEASTAASRAHEIVLSQLEALKSELRCSGLPLSSSIEEIARLKNEAVRHRAVSNGMLDSTSWRLTAPIRRLKGVVDPTARLPNP